MTLRIALYALAAALVGLALTWGLGVAVLEMEFDSTLDRHNLIAMAAILSGFLAVIAALPPRFGLAVLGLALALLAYWTWDIMQTPGDAGTGAIITMLMAIALGCFGLIIIGGRTLLTKPRSEP